MFYTFDLTVRKKQNTTHTAYEDGERRSGQRNDKRRASEQRVDHSSNALANNGLLNICQEPNSRESAHVFALYLSK